MEKEPLTVIARIKTKKGMEDKLQQVLLTLIEPSRADDGCIDYILHRDPEDHGQFMFYEIRKDKKLWTTIYLNRICKNL